jgi:hypothetical protein
MKESYETKKARSIIHRMIEKVIDLFAACRRTNDELETMKEAQRLLHKVNSDYAIAVEDKRQYWNAVLLIVLVIFVIPCDAIITYQAMSIAVEVFGIPSICKHIAPVILVGIEILISYFQILNRRAQQEDSILIRFLEYIVILILIALSILTVMYSIASYTPAMDALGHSAFIVGTIAMQIALLIASLCLHIFLIKNAERITDGIIFLQYCKNHLRVARYVTELEWSQRHKNFPAFTKHSQQLILHLFEFNAKYPDQPIDVLILIPHDVLRAMNVAMGRNIFNIDNEKS